MENLKKTSIVYRKSIDGASEIPKIYSSLTENQAAVLEYVCQVWVFHQDIVMQHCFIRCFLKELPSLFPWPLLPSSTEWVGRQSQWWLLQVWWQYVMCKCHNDLPRLPVQASPHPGLQADSPHGQAHPSPLLIQALRWRLRQGSRTGRCYCNENL